MFSRTILPIVVLPIVMLATLVLLPSVSAKDRTLEEFTAYASRRIASGDAETMGKFVATVDRNGDGIISAEEFAGRIDAYQLVFQTVQPKSHTAGHTLPENWFTDFDKASAEAISSGKPLLVMFSASWCAPCKMMIAQVFPDQKVKEALKSVIPVYIDSEVEQDFAADNGIRAYPTFVCFTPQQQAIANRVGGGDAEAFLELIETFKVAASETQTDE